MKKKTEREKLVKKTGVRWSELSWLPYWNPVKNVVLGVITSKFSELEDKQKMKDRIYEAADIIAKGAGQSRTVFKQVCPLWEVFHRRRPSPNNRRP